MIKKLNLSRLEKDLALAHQTCENLGDCPHEGNIEACPRIVAVRRDYQLEAFHNNSELNYGIEL
jgi:hypothetical protein